MQLLRLQPGLQQAMERQAAAQAPCYQFAPRMISEFRTAIGLIQSGEHVVPLQLQLISEL